MCKGYAAYSSSFDTEFVGALSSGTAVEDNEIATTAEITTEEPKKVSTVPIDSGSLQTDPPTTAPTTPPTTPLTTVPFRIDPGWWRGGNTATRPPLPYRFSSGSFQIKFNVTQDMSPSCRMLVYYVRNRETIADSKVVDIEDSFANKVNTYCILVSESSC